MRLPQKLAIGATSLGGLAIGSLGLGIAHAQTPAPAPAVTAPAPAPNTSANQGGVDNSAAEAPDAAATADVPGGPDVQSGPNVQSGSQSGPDTGGVDTGANK